jgi:N-formylmaleamate deformylase
MHYIMNEEQQGSDQMPDKTQGYNNGIVPPHWLEQTVMANGIRQHFYRTGGKKPSLILLHGFSENGLCWSRVAKALEDGYDLVMVDARGHGYSSGPETGYSQELLTQDVAALIHELGLQHPSLFGHSNGALTAAQVAATFPELIRAVILEDPPWGESSGRPIAATEGNEPWPGFTAWYNAWIAWHKALKTQTPEERIASSGQFLPPGAPGWPEEELLTHLEAQAQFDLDVLNVVSFVPTRTPWQETVKRIACPILLLTGNPQQGAILTPQEAQKIAATWRQGQHVSFAEAGHLMHHEMRGEQFDDFIRVVKVFLHEQ